MCVYVTLNGIFFFFFKQKTAYEMRISDWSSDVCSSDLSENRRLRNELLIARARERRLAVLADENQHLRELLGGTRSMQLGVRLATIVDVDLDPSRSEEHTSELQSLMRISYAVFCLKKKKTHHSITQTQQQHLIEPH